MLNQVEALLAIDWSAVFCFFAYVTSSSTLPVVSRVLLTDVHFPFPATLAAVQAVALSTCLVFWTLLSIFKPRTIGLSRLLPLSVMHSLVSLSHMHNLYRNSLLHYQLARFVQLLALSGTIPLSSSARNSEANLVRTRRARFMRGVFIFVTTIILLLHPPVSPISFAAAVFVPLFNLTGYPQQLRANTRATDLQLQLFTRSLSAVILCFSSPTLDTNHNARLLNLIFNMITDLERPTGIFLHSSALLAFFTFVSVRVAHAKLEPCVFRTAYVLAAVPPLVLHFVMEHTPDVLDGGTMGSNAMLVVVSFTRRGVDLTLILVLLATVHHITVSTIPRYSNEISRFIDEEDAGYVDEGIDDDEDDDERDRVGNEDEPRLMRVFSRSENSSDDTVDISRYENSPSPSTESNSQREGPIMPTLPSTFLTNLDDDHNNHSCTIFVNTRNSYPNLSLCQETFTNGGIFK